ncbi:hypothetical protein JD844_033112 [Phrynosoma platyrhinos]|uniref:AAA+ ATPase domain-containing protein n=1 Tax=Phrynosoma platyrhinos TaxID=52577 RepID=A0ABQ7T734_PHRPL|nr:hypothetical protein JD844_033112 [Phrynosoma platyrhinos]
MRGLGCVARELGLRARSRAHRRAFYSLQISFFLPSFISVCFCPEERREAAMSLWVDKYRPTSLSKLDYHREQAAQLRNLVQCGDFPHLLVYGPSGAGKKTRIMCLLRELYGSGVEKLRIEHQIITAPSKKKIEISTIASNYHLEVNPSDAGNSDRVVIQELLKTVAQSQQLETSTQRDFKVVLLTEVDKLTKDAQHALRRTMEKYMATCRLILCCNSTSKVIAPIRSRCLAVRVPAPSIEDICNILSSVCKKEGLVLPQELAQRIAEKSGRNLRKALLMCEACRVQQLPFTPDQDISETDWEGLLYELLNNCDGQLKAEVAQMAAFYEHRLQLGNKAIYHLEAFVAKFMALYKKFMEDGLEAMMF